MRYLKGHDWYFKKFGIARDAVGHLPLIFHTDVPKGCPECGYEPMCFEMLNCSHYNKLRCNNDKCGAEYGVYHPGDYVEPITYQRLHQSQFGRGVQRSRLIHKTSNSDLWHIPLMGYQPKHYPDGHNDLMIEIWVDETGELYMPGKDPQKIE